MSQDVTVTDMFCGAGGSSIGVEAAGARLRFAANHWTAAVETHNANFPHADHDCADVSQADPRRWPTTDVLIASPECTNHSQAKGLGRRAQQAGLWDEPDPAAERSRATMWCPPRFAEQHHYPLVIIENVVEAARWVGWEAWLRYWHAQGYQWRTLYVNSAHVGSTAADGSRWVPQLRDRMYVVLWKKGNRAPDLELRPACWCWTCEAQVEGRQVFKRPDRRWGRFRAQYVYRCPTCGGEAEPWVAPAATVIDWSLPAERIGDRRRPLRPATRLRIETGLRRFGYQPTQVLTRHDGDDAGRVRPLSHPTWTVPGADREVALVIPMRRNGRARDAHSEPAPTVTASSGAGGQMLAFAPFQVQPPHRWAVASSDAPALAVPDAFYVKGFGDGTDPSMTHHIAEPLGSVTARDHHALLIPFDRTSQPRPAAAHPTSTVTTHDRTGLCWPDVDVDDCRFRMFEPHEIGRAMAFADDYRLAVSSKKDRVKLYGNAVTPPVMAWIFERAVETLR